MLHRLQLAAGLVVSCPIPLRGSAAVSQQAQTVVSSFAPPPVGPPTFRRPVVRPPRCVSSAAGGCPAPLSVRAGWPWKPLHPAMHLARAALDLLAQSALQRMAAGHIRSIPRVRHHGMRQQAPAPRLLRQKLLQRPGQMLHHAWVSCGMQRQQDVLKVGIAPDPAISCLRRRRPL